MGGVETTDGRHLPSFNIGQSTSSNGESFEGAEGSRRQKERDRLLDCLFTWKAREAWREVVLICGATARCDGLGGLHSACELEVRKSHELHMREYFSSARNAGAMRNRDGRRGSLW